MTYGEVKEIDEKISLLKVRIALLEDEVTDSSAKQGISALNRIDKTISIIADYKDELKKIEAKRSAMVNSIPWDNFIGACLLLKLNKKYSWQKIAMIAGGNNTANGIRMSCTRYEW